MYVCVCMILCIYIYIVYAYMYVYIGKQKAFKQKLQAATKHNKQCKEGRSNRFVEVLN